MPRINRNNVNESNKLQEFSEYIKTIKETLEEIRSELDNIKPKVDKFAEFINQYSPYMESYVRTQMLNMQNFDSDTEHTIVRNKNYENSYHDIDTLKKGYKKLTDAITSFAAEITSAFEEEKKNSYDYMLIRHISLFFCDPKKNINNLSFQELLDLVVHESNKSKALPHERSSALNEKFKDIRVLSEKIYASKELNIEYKWPEKPKQKSLIIFPELYSNREKVTDACEIPMDSRQEGINARANE